MMVKYLLFIASLTVLFGNEEKNSFDRNCAMELFKNALSNLGLKDTDSVFKSQDRAYMKPISFLMLTFLKDTLYAYSLQAGCIILPFCCITAWNEVIKF